jgi:hypothetical protein
LVTDDDIGSIDHFILTKYNFSMHFKLGILLKNIFVIITEQKQRRDSQGNILLKVKVIDLYPHLPFWNRLVNFNTLF